jgi:hypothetical protein
MAFVFKISPMLKEASALAMATMAMKMPSLDLVAEHCSAKGCRYSVTLVQ